MRFLRIFTAMIIFFVGVGFADDDNKADKKGNFSLEVFSGVTGITGRNIRSNLDYRALYNRDEGRLIYSFNSLPIYFRAPYGFNTFIVLSYRPTQVFNTVGLQLWFFNWRDAKEGMFRIVETGSGSEISKAKPLNYSANSNFFIRTADIFVTRNLFRKSGWVWSFYGAIKITVLDYRLRVYTKQELIHQSLYSFFDGRINISGEHKTEYSTLIGPSLGINFNKKLSVFYWKSFVRQSVVFGDVKHIGDLNSVVQGRVYYFGLKDTISVYYKDKIDFAKFDFTFFPVTETGSRIDWSLPWKFYEKNLTVGLGGAYSLWWDVYFGPKLNGNWEIGKPFKDNNLRWTPRRQNIGFYNGFIVLVCNF